jgi:integral membrane protein (TIGR01906 family)
MERAFAALARLTLVVALPVFLLLSNVQLLMSETFLEYEYARADLPPAAGLSTERRFQVARAALEYVNAARSPAERPGQVTLTALREMRQGDRVLFNERELAHLVDVRELAGRAFWVNILAGLLLAVAGVTLFAVEEQATATVLRHLLYGCLLTIAALSLVALTVYLNFDWFFVRFHRTFFAGDSWLFNASDTLIQLFPPQFWFDAAQGLVLLTVGEAVVLGGIAWGWRRRLRTYP